MKSRSPEEHPDGIDILVCKIMVWEPSSKSTIELNPPDNKCLILRECQEIEIVESYKKLIGKATVKFPRGTVIKNQSLVKDPSRKEQQAVVTERLNNGAIIEKREGYAVARPKDFHTGQRIRIYLGYYRDKGKIFKNEQERIKVMEAEVFQKNPDFDGYITKCGVSTPIQIECENLASVLKRKVCSTSFHRTKENITVNEILGTGSKYDLLKDTGLRLHPRNKECEINIGRIDFTPDMTVADMLENWSDHKLFCYIRYDDSGYPCLRVGRSYFSQKTADSILNDDQSALGTLIEFNYHVAKDDLTLMNTDPAFLAVEAQAWTKTRNNAIFRITLRLNPEWTGKNDTEHKKFQLLNETKLSKKNYRLVSSIPQTKESKVDLSKYTLIQYMSNKIGITKDELVAEAMAYFDSYNMNGIEGSITVFGDRHLQSGMKVELLDTMEPEKNGWYLVEEVTTKFGVNGYRQTLKIPYCIAKPEKEDQTKTENKEENK